MAGIIDIGRLSLVLLHAVFPRRRALLLGRKLLHVSRIRRTTEAESFTDRENSLHLMNREDWRKYQDFDEELEENGTV
jgi:hypothetical protein